LPATRAGNRASQSIRLVLSLWGGGLVGDHVGGRICSANV
jgi:hypothetical protein